MAAELSSSTVDDRPAPTDRYELHAEETRRRQLEYALSRLESHGDLSAEQREIVAALADAITGEVASTASTVMSTRSATSERGAGLSR